MRFCCIICSEFFLISDDISVITCGHVFHKECLTKWLNHNQSCPQCRQFLNIRRDVISKLYLEIGPDGEKEEKSMEALENKINELEANLRQSSQSESMFLTKWMSASAEATDLSSRLKDVQARRNKEKEESSILEATLRQKLTLLTAENKTINELRKTIAQLNAKITEYDTIKKLVYESSAEIEQMKIDGSSGKQWTVICGVLKKVVNQSNAENNNLRTRIKNLESNRKRDKQEFLREIELLTKLKEPSRHAVMRQSAALGKPTMKTNSPIQASPVSSSPTAIHVDEANMAMKGKENGTRPKLKKCSTAACLAAKDQTKLSPIESDSIDNYNIMKRRRMIGKPAPKTKAMGTGYDGMGGHSKPDIYPSNKQLG